MTTKVDGSISKRKCRIGSEVINNSFSTFLAYLPFIKIFLQSAPLTGEKSDSANILTDQNWVNFKSTRLRESLLWRNRVQSESQFLFRHYFACLRRRNNPNLQNAYGFWLCNREISNHRVKYFANLIPGKTNPVKGRNGVLTASHSVLSWSASVWVDELIRSHNLFNTISAKIAIQISSSFFLLYFFRNA